MNPSTSLGTRSKVGMAKPSPPIRQAGNIGHLLVRRGVCRRSLRSACAHVTYRCRCRDKGVGHDEQTHLSVIKGAQLLHNRVEGAVNPKARVCKSADILEQGEPSPEGDLAATPVGHHI